MAWLYTIGSTNLILKPVLVGHKRILKHICTSRNALCDRLWTFESGQHTLLVFNARFWLINQSEFKNQPQFDCEIRPKRFQKDKIEVIHFLGFKSDVHSMTVLANQRNAPVIDANQSLGFRDRAWSIIMKHALVMTLWMWELSFLFDNMTFECNDIALWDTRRVSSIRIWSDFTWSTRLSSGDFRKYRHSRTSWTPRSKYIW